MAQNGSIKKRVIPSIGVGLVLSFVLFSCTTPAIVSNQNLSYVYNKEQTFLHPEFVIFNKNDSISALYTRISSKELLFSQSGDLFLSTARIMVNFRFQADFDQSAVIDSGSVSLLMSDSLHPEFFYVYLEIKAKKGTKLQEQLQLLKDAHQEEQLIVKEHEIVDEATWQRELGKLP